MSRRRPNYVPPPRILSAYQVACRLGKSESWFRDNLPTLAAEGFPSPDALLGGWDVDAIELWLDSRSGIVDAVEGDGELLRRLEAFADGDG